MTDYSWARPNLPPILERINCEKITSRTSLNIASTRWIPFGAIFTKTDLRFVFSTALLNISLWINRPYTITIILTNSTLYPYFRYSLGVAIGFLLHRIVLIPHWHIDSCWTWFEFIETMHNGIDWRICLGPCGCPRRKAWHWLSSRSIYCTRRRRRIRQKFISSQEMLNTLLLLQRRLAKPTIYVFW